MAFCSIIARERGYMRRNPLHKHTCFIDHPARPSFKSPNEGFSHFCLRSDCVLLVHRTSAGQGKNNELRSSTGVYLAVSGTHERKERFDTLRALIVEKSDLNRLCKLSELIFPHRFDFHSTAP